MPDCKLTLSANAGVAMELDDLRLWVDVPHDEPVPGLSAVTDALWEKMRRDERFFAPDLLFFTHCHPDHYSAALTSAAAAQWPKALIAAPGQEGGEGRFVLSGEEKRLSLKGAELSFRYLPHLGRHTNKIPHYGCLVDYHGARILFTGDSVAAGHALKALLDDKPVELAVVTFPWITTQGGRAALERFVRPKHIAVVHLPFSEDDLYQDREQALAAQPLMTADTRLFLEPLQTESFALGAPEP